MTTASTRNRRATRARKSSGDLHTTLSHTESGGRSARFSFAHAVRTESTNYFLLLGTTLFLVVFGLVMVLSSSSVDSFVATKGFFTTFLKQGMFVLIGVPVMLIASRLPVDFWRRNAWWFIGGAWVVQLLVFTPLGYESGGNRNWIRLGPISGQPSELVKIALCVFFAFILAKKQRLLKDWMHVLIPVIPVGGASLLLVVMGSDLGTAMIIASIMFAALYFAGVDFSKLAMIALAGALVVALLAITSPNRMARIMGFLGGHGNDVQGIGWQSTHGLWALAHGGVFGVGLGNSTMKWSWLPEADNDFIFAIIGEELGLIGAIVVIALFVVLAIAMMRIYRQTDDSFQRILVGCVLVWIMMQAFVNIAVVIGLLPVLGVPLPLVSSGGSALVTTLLAIGIVLSFARTGSFTPVPASRSTARKAHS